MGAERKSLPWLTFFSPYFKISYSNAFLHRFRYRLAVAESDPVKVYNSSTNVLVLLMPGR